MNWIDFIFPKRTKKNDKLESLEKRMSQVEFNLNLFRETLTARLDDIQGVILQKFDEVSQVCNSHLRSSKEETRKIKMTTRDQGRSIQDVVDQLNSIELQLNHILEAFNILISNQINLIRDKLLHMSEQNELGSSKFAQHKRQMQLNMESIDNILHKLQKQLIQIGNKLLEKDQE